MSYFIFYVKKLFYFHKRSNLLSLQFKYFLTSFFTFLIVFLNRATVIFKQLVISPFMTSIETKVYGYTLSEKKKKLHKIEHQSIMPRLKHNAYTSWAPFSSKLNPFNFFLLNFLKDAMYLQPFVSMNGMKVKSKTNYLRYNCCAFLKWDKTYTKRVRNCIDFNDRPFKHLLK